MLITCIFDDQSVNWSQDPDINMLFLRAIENYVNDKLKMRGHVFLNEVFDELGLSRTSKGALVGWLWSPDSGRGLLEGISFVVASHDDSGAIKLTFDVDGVIFDELDSKKQAAVVELADVVAELNLAVDFIEKKELRQEFEDYCADPSGR